MISDMAKEAYMAEMNQTNFVFLGDNYDVDSMQSTLISGLLRDGKKDEYTTADVAKLRNLWVNNPPYASIDGSSRSMIVDAILRSQEISYGRSIEMLDRQGILSEISEATDGLVVPILCNIEDLVHYSPVFRSQQLAELPEATHYVWRADFADQHSTEPPVMVGNLLHIHVGTLHDGSNFQSLHKFHIDEPQR